ncbi:MAG: hypothetical protein ACC656_06385 [Candidatus Heimdallarchaeota archaeon]
MSRKKTRKITKEKKDKKFETNKIIDSSIKADVKEHKTIPENFQENKDKNNGLIADIEKLDKVSIKSRLLELENENAELRAMIEKARKKLRIYSKKLDLTEEKEEQWKIACYNIAGIFAEKSQVSIEDILKKVEAPLEDGIAF